MAKKINVGNIMAGLDAVAAQTEEFAVMSKPMGITAKLIHINPDNKASKYDTEESIETLAASIALVGLIHPIVVNQTADNQFLILSGERRFKAITTHLKWETIPCNVYHDLDKAMIVVVTTEANMETREYTLPQKIELFDDLDKSLVDLKERGLFKGSINNRIMEKLKLTRQQISKYRVIANNTTTEERDKITNVNKAAKAIRKTLSPEYKKKETGFPLSEQSEPSKRETEVTFSEQTDTSKHKLSLLTMETMVEADAARHQLRLNIGGNGRYMMTPEDYSTVVAQLDTIAAAYKELDHFVRTHSIIVPPPDKTIRE